MLLLRPLLRLLVGLCLALSASGLVRAQTYTTPYTFTTFAGDGVPGLADGTGSAARFTQPLGTAADNAGNVYIADYYNNMIRKITPAGVVTTLAGSADTGVDADGTGNAASFYQPSGVAVDSSGNVYVADTYNYTIRKITPAGVVTTLAGLAGNGGSEDGTGNAASFYQPSGVAVDSSGNVYVADTYNYTIRKITPAGVVTTLAGLSGTSGSANGTGSSARFNNPTYLTVDSSGNVYVADTNNHTIRKITSAGAVTTLAGLPGTRGSIDGTGNGARFSNPKGISVDGAGNLYVCDSGNRTIRKVTSSGVVTTLAGLAGNIALVNGTGSSARFIDPVGMAVDGAGNLYVTESTSHIVRKGKSAKPEITAVNPTSGPQAGGTTVILTGANFTGATAVSFGGTAATSFTVNSATQITAVSPARSIGIVDISVTAPFGTSDNGANDQFTYLGTPGAPTIGSATLVGGTSARITFTAPASNGGTAITSYTVTASPGGLTATGTGSPLTVTGLTDGVTYTFSVTASNSIGTGSASAASNALVADGAPPTVVSVVRQSPSTQNLATGTTIVTFRFTFSEPVTNVTAGSFAIENIGGGNVVGNIGAPIPVSTSIYDVPLTITSGAGEFRLKVIIP